MTTFKALSIKIFDLIEHDSSVIYSPLEDEVNFFRIAGKDFIKVKLEERNIKINENLINRNNNKNINSYT
tara:strand:+ start:682 stop:891 length:210 start_codon:yes stop_codon:yes gene_type:complete